MASIARTSTSNWEALDCEWRRFNAVMKTSGKTAHHSNAGKIC
jgi:hypothetical protein